MDWAWLNAGLDAVLGSPLWLYCTHIALLSGTAIGGGMLGAMPDLQRFVVDTHHWVTNEQFTSAFAMAQASPGPNFVYVAIIGWQIAGWLGAVLATIAVAAPPTLITFTVMRLGAKRAGTGRLQEAVREGLLPVSAGMILASAWVLANTVDRNWRAGAMTLLFVVILLRTRLHPLWLIGLGALAGVAGVV